MKTLLTLILASFLSVGAVEAVAFTHQEKPIQIQTPDNPPTETILYAEFAKVGCTLVGFDD